jgi:hypothetical protein
MPCVPCRLLSALPPDCWVAEVIPAIVTDTLGAVVQDGVLCAAMPAAFRAVALRVLAKLRPDVQQVLAVADQGQEAVNAARDLVQQVRGVCSPLPLYLTTAVQSNMLYHAWPHSYGVWSALCIPVTMIQSYIECIQQSICIRHSLHKTCWSRWWTMEPWLQCCC